MKVKYGYLGAVQTQYSEGLVLASEGRRRPILVSRSGRLPKPKLKA